MKYALLFVAMCTALFIAGFSATGALATDDNDKKVTICHAAGQDGTTKYVTLTISENAVYGPGGHFNEDGTPQAGHEDDYLGACQGEEEEDVFLAAGVTFNEATCDAGPSFSFVKTTLEGIGRRPFYSIEGTLVSGNPVAGQTYTVTAIPVDGYTFGSQTTTWTHTFAAAPTNCNPPPECPNGDLNGDAPGCNATTPCPVTPSNPTGSLPDPPGGKDGNPGNDACLPDPTEPETPTEPTPTTPEPTTPEPTTPETPTTPEPPVVTTPESPESPPVTAPPVVKKPTLEKELEKQAKKNGATNDPGYVQAKGELPRTGLPLGWAVALGFSLIGAGLKLRRISG